MRPLSAAKGRFVWFELMTSDPAAAISFYSKVVGWETESWGPETGYTMWKVPGGLTIGGVMALQEEAKAMGARPSWLGNLCVESVDAALAALAAHGGQVYKPAFDVPGVGRVAIVGDCCGAVFALYQPEGQAPGHDGMAVHGEVSWSELATDDPEKAMALYSAVAGWSAGDSMDMGPEGRYQMFGVSADREGTVGGMFKRPPMIPVSMWTYYIYVADLDAAIAAATANGGQVLHGPMPIPGGDRVVNLMDPQGAPFALHGK